MGSLFGGKPQGASQSQLDAESRQKAEIEKLNKQEQQRIKAAGRKRQGRASLISGAETGTQGKQETLG